jgi:putative membrane protein
MRKLISTIAAVVLLSGAAIAQDKATQKFITEAIQGNYAEIKMGELAQSNGQSSEVKAFGQMLQNDHGAALQKSQAAAKDVGVTTVPGGPNAKQKADYDKMAKMNGAAFDKAFAQHMVKDHKKDIAAYQKASKKQDAAGQYAQQTLPTLQKHLETAQSVQKQATAKR